MRNVLMIDAAIPLHAFLHHKHAALAPRLAEALRQMKAEGVIERYRIESLQAVAEK